MSKIYAAGISAEIADFFQEPTEQQLEEVIAELKEQLEFCDDETAAEELRKKIGNIENQLKELIIKNNAL